MRFNHVSTINCPILARRKSQDREVLGFFVFTLLTDCQYTHRRQFKIRSAIFQKSQDLTPRLLYIITTLTSKINYTRDSAAATGWLLFLHPELATQSENFLQAAIVTPNWAHLSQVAARANLFFSSPKSDALQMPVL